jgi:CRISPR/Cas system-associated exonuclease Cas4 (RecB family)
VDAVVAHYHARWAAEFHPEKVRIVRRGLHADDYRATGEECLRYYHAEETPFDQAETLGLEAKFQFALDPNGRYAIMGFIDRLARPSPGIYEVHDYKTGASLPRDSDLRSDRQLSLYQMAVREKYPDATEVRLIWHYLQVRQRLVLSRSEPELEAHRKQAIRLIDTIEAARDYPARESALCRWCEYRDICPTQQGALAIEKAEEAASEKAMQAARLAEAPAGPAAQASLFGGGAPAGGASAAPTGPRPVPPRGRPSHPAE